MAKGFWQKFREKIFNFEDIQHQERFILTPMTDETGNGKQKENNAQKGKETGEEQGDSTQENSKQENGGQNSGQENGRKENGKDSPEKGKRKIKKPLSLQKAALKEIPDDPEQLRVSADLETNREYINKLYVLPKNKDIIVRDFYIALDPPLKAFMVFIDGLAANEIINNAILKSLMVLIEEETKVDYAHLAEYIKEHLLPGHDVAVLENYRSILDMVNYGNTAIFVEGSDRSLVIETKGWDRRTVSEPETEQVILGPQEAFNETLRSNTGLIRKAIRNEKLITEMVKVGSQTNIDVAIMYLDDIANPKLVEEVKRRVESIKTDYVGAAGVLEQFIEDAPYSLTPQVLTTERPDRTVSFLVEGHVAIIVDGGARALIVPITLFSLLHTPEDYYLRIPYGNFVRILRVVALFITILTPGTYIAIVNFHQEMVPTELLLAIAASHATVPFPTVFELFVMEFSFELIREAGVRVPGVIGNTIGIVGALILGQAAAQAGIISPILIIVVAITGLASFAIPNYSISFALRLMRFIFAIFAAFFGFLGIAGGLLFFLISLVSMKSFGVPFLAPVGPRTRTEPDVVLRGPVWSMEKRVDYLNPLDKKRQPNISRGWIKNSQRRRKK